MSYHIGDILTTVFWAGDCGLSPITKGPTSLVKRFLTEKLLLSVNDIRNAIKLMSFKYSFFYIVILLFLSWEQAACFQSKHEILLSHYSVNHMIPTMGTHHAAIVSQDRLTCFGNRDLREPSYLDTLLCMLPLPDLLYSHKKCTSVWGSRGVVVSVTGSVEFLLVKNLPAEASNADLKATRWLELQSISDETIQREIKHIPAEPFYLCARSIDWLGRDSSFHLEFRPEYLRARDRTNCGQKTLLHVLLVLAVSSRWLLPYLASFIFCVVTYTYGMYRFLIALAFSLAVLCLAPFMFTKRNRHLARLYIDYFYYGRKAREASDTVRERLPLFQALFFSCALMCTGSVGAYIMYSYLGVNRDTRNSMIQMVMGISTGWFVFVLCRSFDYFFQRWSWLALTYFLLQFLEPHLNPQCREEAVVIILLITAAVEYILVPKLNLNKKLDRVLGIYTGIESSNAPMSVLKRTGSFASRKNTEGNSDNSATSKSLHSKLEWTAGAESSEDDGGSDSASTVPNECLPKDVVNITVNVQIERGSNERLLVRTVRTAVAKAVKDALHK